MIYLITAIVLLIFLIFDWLLGSWMGLAGANLWILRGGLALVGIAAAAAFLWFRRTPQSAPDADGEAAPAKDDELDLLISAAETKLRAAKLPRGGSLGTLPGVLVIGLPGSAKTSVVTNSGLDPELLAGAVIEDGAIAPTSCVNIWYSAATVFIEPAGNILADAKSWRAFVRRMAPTRLRSVVQRGPQAPRAIVLCFDAETFLRSTQEAADQSRLLHARLAELARTLGVTLPVYVVFTRIDRVPHFEEYVATLSRDEAARVLGSTLALETPSAGLYAEEQRANVGRSFDELYRSLAGARLDFLSRESNESKAGRAYEFPREFRKLRTAISEFLMELCRPSQFAVGPVLRGYYFSGVRPVLQETAVPARVEAMPQPARADAGATVLFRSATAVEAPPPAQSVRTRRVPQWVFLTQLFRGVILEDHAAMGASGVSTRVNSTRRLLLIAAAAVGMMFSVALTVSWARNRTLESTALAAARGLSLDSAPSLDALRRLDALRESVETLSRYHAEGPPLSYRWGLYQGNALYPELRRIYFDRFRSLLFAGAQSKLIDTLHGLPPKPGPEYGPVYDTLKAYLITTLDHERSTRAFLPPVLLDRWSANRGIDPERMTLAARQFAFYADELKKDNPYSREADTDAVSSGRDYLAQFAGIERVYRAMLAEAAKAGAAIEFNRRYPGSGEAVVDTFAVSGAFTKPGWQFMNAAVRNPARYFAGEQWVLGDQQTVQLDAAHLENQLRARYSADFLTAWRTYLKSAVILRYANLQDAARKLNLLAGNRSPLLALLSLASDNTAVADPAISGPFAPVAAVVPAGHTDAFIAPQNQPYMSALLALESAVEQAAAQPGGATEISAEPVLSSASNAKIAARQIAQGFKPDAEGHVDATVEKLLEDPITQVEGLLRGLGPQELNAKGKSLCAALRPVLSKYPLDRSATAEDTVAEVNAALRKPDGAFWVFFDANLQKLVTQQGGRYVPNPNATVHLTPEFLTFLNQVTVLSDALYSGGAQDPHFSYTITPTPSDGIRSLEFSLDGQTLSYNGGAAAAKQFAWQGNAAHEAKASVRFGNGPDLVWSNSQGPWAIFHFFDKAERWQASGPEYSLEWTIRIGKDPVTLPNGKALIVRVNLGGAASAILKSPRLTCVSQVAR